MLDKLNYILMKTYYYLIENKQKILLFLVVITIILGLIGFSCEKNASLMGVINNTLALFVAEWDGKDNLVLDFAKFFGIILLFFSVLIFFFKDYFTAEHIRFAQKRPYDLIVGLTEQNVSLLKNTYDKDSVIIIEKDKNHKHLNFFKERGFSVIEGHTKETLDKLDYTNMGRCIISTRNDRKNIALGKFLLNKKDQMKGKILQICIGNRDLNVLFKQDIITNDIKHNINILTYSLYENMAKKLFLEHGILGNYLDIINSNDNFSMVLIGDSELAIELVYHIAFLSALPNENQLTLYLVGVDAKKFKNRVKKTFPKIEKIPHLTLKALELDSDNLKFYEDTVWKSPNLTNIFIATKDEERNLDITINLQDTTYVKSIGHKKFYTKVLFALYHNLGLAEEIDKNSKAFKNFYSFGNIAKTSTKEILFDEEFDKIAKLIHNDYRKENDVLPKTLDEEWLYLAQHKQDANRTQALHLDIKLLFFGLAKESSRKDWQELLSVNRKIFDSKLHNSKDIQSRIVNFKASDFPVYFNRDIDKLARAEHNRWNAFHYLHGWEYSSEKNIEAKEHNCLQTFENFTTDESKETYKYDLISVYYLPDYLAKAGFEIKELD